jgi:hypothetical protein
MRVPRSLLATSAMLMFVGVASAAEPTLLTQGQLDEVVAGNLAPPPPAFGPVGNSDNVKTPNGVIQH